MPPAQSKKPVLPCPDWVFASGSNVHVAKDRSWFGDDYTPFRSVLADGLQVEGIGTVDLPTKRSPLPNQGPAGHTTLRLANVLHVPGAICNILGFSLAFEYQLDMNFQDPAQSSIWDEQGRPLAYFRRAPPSNLFALRLSGPPVGPKVGPSPLGAEGIYISATWPPAEIQRWVAHQARVSKNALGGGSDGRNPYPRPLPSSQSPTSARSKPRAQQPVSVDELGQLVGGISLGGNKPPEEKKTSFMFSTLHPAIVDAVAHDIPSVWFNERDTELNSNNDWDTNVMGDFKCDNRECRKSGWASKKVAIHIRGYPGNGYNAVVYNQRCTSCDVLGNFTLDETSYVERVTYRLKKWAGVRVDIPMYESKSGPPHEFEFCEGGKRGHCPACIAAMELKTQMLKQGL